MTSLGCLSQGLSTCRLHFLVCLSNTPPSSFAVLLSQGSSGTAVAYSSYAGGYGMWLDMGSLPSPGPELKAVVGVPSGVLRLAPSHNLTALVLDCEDVGDALPANPAVAYVGTLSPRSANDPLAGKWWNPWPLLCAAHAVRMWLKLSLPFVRASLNSRRSPGSPCRYITLHSVNQCIERMHVLRDAHAHAPDA